MDDVIFAQVVHQLHVLTVERPEGQRAVRWLRSQAIASANKRKHRYLDQFQRRRHRRTMRDWWFRRELERRVGAKPPTSDGDEAWRTAALVATSVRQQDGTIDRRLGLAWPSDPVAHPELNELNPKLKKLAFHVLCLLSPQSPFVRNVQRMEMGSLTRADPKDDPVYAPTEIDTEIIRILVTKGSRLTYAKLWATIDVENKLSIQMRAIGDRCREMEKHRFVSIASGPQGGVAVDAAGLQWWRQHGSQTP